MLVKIEMDIPKCCMKCPVADHYVNVLYCRILNDYVRGRTKRPKVCPIKEVQQ